MFREASGQVGFQNQTHPHLTTKPTNKPSSPEPIPHSSSFSSPQSQTSRRPPLPQPHRRPPPLPQPHRRSPLPLRPPLIPRPPPLTFSPKVKIEPTKGQAAARSELGHDNHAPGEEVRRHHGAHSPQPQPHGGRGASSLDADPRRPQPSSATARNPSPSTATHGDRSLKSARVVGLSSARTRPGTGVSSRQGYVAGKLCWFRDVKCNPLISTPKLVRGWTSSHKDLTHAHLAVDFKWKECCPMVFRELEFHFGSNLDISGKKNYVRTSKNKTAARWLWVHRRRWPAGGLQDTDNFGAVDLTMAVNGSLQKTKQEKREKLARKPSV